MNIAKKTLITLIYCLAIVKVNAQVELLQKAADKVTQCRNFSYTVANTNKEFFGDELFHETTIARFVNRPAELKDVPYYAIDHTLITNTFTGSYTDIYNGNELILLDLNHRTYRTKKDEQNMYAYQGSVPELLNTALSDVKSGGFKVTLLGDSTVKNILCYHIKMIPTDSEKLDSRRDFLVSKANSNLVYFRNTGSGEATKGGMSLGTIHIFIEDNFSDYKFNTNMTDIAGMSIPEGFKTEEKPKPLLNPGEIAPDWELSSVLGKSTSFSKLRGKVVFIDFTGDGCPACMLAIPPLNNLAQKYKGTDVAIISINIDGTKNSIASLVKKYHIDYPVYMNGKVTADAYHVQAIPNFYIINKSGIISNVHEGFFDNFEQQVTAEIEKLR